MKKILFAYLLIIIALFSLTSCSNGKARDNYQAPSKNRTQQATKSNDRNKNNKNALHLRDFKTLSKGTSRAVIIGRLGEPTRDIGSGMPVYVYELGNGQAVILNFSPDDKLSKLTIQEKDRPVEVPSQSLVTKTNENLDRITEQIDKNNGTDPMSNLSSSNPYDYLKDNPNYNEIIKIGYDALPVLEERLKNSSESGLREYIMCIAIEEIVDCDLKQFKDSQWDSAENFQLKWNQYLKELPVKVNKILKSGKSPKEKEKEIAKLGAPAIQNWPGKTGQSLK